MSDKVKNIDIKNHRYYFLNDIINMKSFDLNNIKTDEKPYKNAILNIKGSDYCCIISFIIKNEVINLMQSADLTGKKWSIIDLNNLF